MSFAVIRTLGGLWGSFRMEDGHEKDQALTKRREKELKIELMIYYAYIIKSPQKSLREVFREFLSC